MDLPAIESRPTAALLVSFIQECSSKLQYTGKNIVDDKQYGNHIHDRMDFLELALTTFVRT